jgi:KEOPS complex subunit Cgi121
MEFEIRHASMTLDDPAAFLRQIREVSNELGTHVVVLDAEKMAGKEHVRSALEHAARSCARGDPIARSFEMEAMLYAAGTRQTRIARNFGPHSGENRCFIGVSPPDAATWSRLARTVRYEPEPEALSDRHRQRLCALYEISEKELAIVGTDRLTELVLERVALLDAYR